MMRVGFNVFEWQMLERLPEFSLPLQNGADFLFCHTSPEKLGFADEYEKAARLSGIAAEHGADLIANFEFQNAAEAFVGSEGRDWCRTPDGCHRLDPDPAFFAALNDKGNLYGVAYDEFEYAISARNLSLWWGSKLRFGAHAFPPLKTRDAYAQGETFSAALEAYVKDVKAMGAPRFAGEHVFPILFHAFARAGMVPNFKSMKESCTNLAFAVAAGAALEYGTELWTCVDLWYRQSFPGHSAEELYANLVFAYLSGVDLAYVESAPALVKDGKLTDRGEAFLRFVKEYKGKERDYRIADYRPEIGILRYDDTYWGQNLFWDRGLYGNGRLRPDARSKEWIEAVDAVTFGESGRASFNLNRIDRTLLQKHRSFCSMNALAVFDDRVRKAALSSLKLAFLCGVRISPETLSDVSLLVRENGLTVVTPKRFVPERFSRLTAGELTQIGDGKGTWIVTDDFTSPALRRRIAPFLGERGTVRLPFADRELVLRIAPDGDGFSCRVNQKS
ncbi:MAG: hypothetical protein IJK89_01315 [Clostridia bacterium]|nr:hypothetical protein [Clostridia bacterium]